MINVVIEGPSDQGAVQALVRATGREVAQVVIKRGKANLDRAIPNYVRSARRSSWVVFRDSDTVCPVELRQRLLQGAEPSPRFLLRIVHPMIEAWLLADRAGFARHFAVREASIPTDTESLQNAKQTTLAICAGSRNRHVRSDMVLPDGRSGPVYGAMLNEFATEAWNVEAAAEESLSLRRAVARVSELPD